MTTNFDYLKTEPKFSTFADVAISAERIILIDPEACIINCRRAMEFAVKESGRAPETFNYVNAHGTSTPMNDKTETAAVKLVFGEHAKNMVINSTKSMTGHLLGAAGGVEAVACALQIKNSKVHRTLGLKVADPECDLDYAPEGTRDMKITGALSNSLGFGGHNACIAFAPVED